MVASNQLLQDSLVKLSIVRQVVCFVWLGLDMVLMIICNELSQEILLINVLIALESSLEHCRKHVLVLVITVIYLWIRLKS